MRLGELLGLRWRGLDFQRGLVSVQQQLTRQRHGGYHYAEPKTARGRRTIDVGPATLQALRLHRDQQETYRRA
jgi:integrase